MRVCFYTLGCKVNLNETGALEQMFRSAGFTIVPEGEEADVFVVNSCTVTNFGDQKSRKWLRRAKRENPGAVTVLTGCYPQAFPEEAARFLEADLVCGNGDRKAILENVMKLLDGHERIVAIAPHARGERFEELPVERFEAHTRAFIKVEDGCNRQCAYCVIPRARGPVRSRAEESARWCSVPSPCPATAWTPGRTWWSWWSTAPRWRASSASVWAAWTPTCSRRSTSPGWPRWTSSARSST